jgi:hypothetical protein
MNSRIRRITTVAATAVATLGVVAIVPASASAMQPSSGRGMPDSFGCGSVPKFVSSTDGGFTGSGISIRSGPSTNCARYGLGYQGNILKVWCLVANGGINWVYLNARTTGVRGWSDAHFVTWSGSLPACTS